MSTRNRKSARRFGGVCIAVAAIWSSHAHAESSIRSDGVDDEERGVDRVGEASAAIGQERDVPSIAVGTEVGAAVPILDRIVVKGQALQLRDSAFSTTQIGQAAIAADRVSDIDSLFRYVPGMTVRSIGYGAVASSTVIRGFGGGGHGGDLGVVIDGVPLNEANSHADGYVDVQVLVPLEISQLTVYRGPVSALYGNFNRGGLIAFETRKSGDYAEFDGSMGQYGTVDMQAALGLPLANRNQLNIATQLFHTDGFRAQSQSERKTVAGRYSTVLSERLDLALSARLHSADADHGARLSRVQFDVDPYGIDPRTQNDGASKDFRSLRADLGYSLLPGLRLLGFGYDTRQQFTRYFTRPVSGGALLQREESYDRDVQGVGFSLNGVSSSTRFPLTYVAGVETFRERTAFEFHDGLARRVRVGPAINDRESDISSVSAFGEANVGLHRLLELTLGLRYDRFSGQCRLLGPEAGTDPCDRLESIDNASPKLGAKAQVTDWLQLRTSIAEGFAIPSGFTKYAPGAQALEPSELRQTELGLLLQAGPVEIDLVGYRIRSSEEIRAVSPGVFENFGATLRRGVELSVKWALTPDLDLRGVHAHADSEILRNANSALLGNSVTGVPRRSGTLNLAWRATPALTFDAGYRHVGGSWMDSANSRRSASYSVIDAGASWQLETRLPTRLSLDIENLTDRVHATAVSLSGGEEWLTPGPPRFFRIGAQIGF